MKSLEPFETLPRRQGEPTSSRRPSLAAILVHYHSSDLLARSVEALRQDLESEGLEAELVVIDNGSTEAERDEISSLPVRVLETSGNPGYAAALNLGIGHTDAQVLFLMNPDVQVLPGCLAALSGALDAGAAVAGPKFYWDRQRRFLLPPTEKRTRRSALLTALAGHGPRFAALARRRWRAHARRHWQARRPLPTTALSGAMLAVRRDAVDLVGSFDEGYRLYFEENEWLMRLRAKGLVSVMVPSAHAVHLYNQSAAREPAAQRWFAESRLRYEADHYGARFTTWLHALERHAKATAEVAVESGPPRIGSPDSDHGARQERWVEISPSPHGFPAAVTRLSPAAREWTFPESVWSYLAPGTYYLTLCLANGRELVRRAFVRPEARAPAEEIGTTVPLSLAHDGI